MPHKLNSNELTGLMSAYRSLIIAKLDDRNAQAKIDELIGTEVPWQKLLIIYADKIKYGNIHVRRSEEYRLILSKIFKPSLIELSKACQTISDILYEAADVEIGSRKPTSFVHDTDLDEQDKQDDN